VKQHRNKILILHSQYRISGGEERMVDLEVGTLKAMGYQVSTHIVQSSDHATLTEQLRISKAMVADNPHWPSIAKYLTDFDPSAIHIHNLLPNLGYDILSRCLDWALKKGRLVVLTIHNQRWVCANGLFFRNEKSCTKCFDDQNPLWGAVHNCRSRWAESVAYAGAIQWAWMKNFYNHPALKLIALNDLTASRLKQVFPCSQVAVLPNPVEVPAKTTPYVLPPWPGKRLAVIGRLSVEKGIKALVSALRYGNHPTQHSTQNPTLNPTNNPTIQFVIAGDGPLKDFVEQEAAINERVLYLGRLPEATVPALLDAVDGLYWSSLVEEQSPTVLRLAQAKAVPTWGPQGLLTRGDLSVWGPILTPQEWAQKLTAVFGA
jgi:glycosyltransferase involved in cell wall biosynthesis